MPLPLLNYSQITETWKKVGLNKNYFKSHILLDSSGIYATCEGSRLKHFSYSGECTDIAITDGKISLYDDKIYYVQAGILFPEQVKCDRYYYKNGSDLYCAEIFLDKYKIVKYENNGKTCQSMLIDEIFELEVSDNKIIARAGDGLYVFDSDLMLITKTEEYVVDYAKNTILSFDGYNSKITLLDTNWRHKASTELEGEPFFLRAGEKYTICATNVHLYALDEKLNTVWSKAPTEISFLDGTFLVPVPYVFAELFSDGREHILCAKEKEITIYDVKTGLAGWRQTIEYPICGIGVGDCGFAVSSYNGGGVHYFGGNPKWNADF